MKLVTRDEALQRYGAIDYASKRWPHQAQWMRMLEIQPNMFPEWMVMDTKMPVKHIACNVDMYPALDNALRAIAKKGLAKFLKTYDGCFNIRPVRGSNNFSWHSYGLAIDLNAETNPMGQTKGDFRDHMDVVQCFKDESFVWGGDFNGRKDNMHFQFAIG